MAIYFVQAEHGGPIKIGYAINIIDRHKQLQVASPYKLIVLAHMKGGHLDENALHNRFAEYRLHGEWFLPCEELFEFIKNLPKFEIANGLIVDDSLPTLTDSNTLWKLYEVGYNLQAIGSIFGVSKQRIHQILQKIPDYWIIRMNRPRSPAKPIEQAYNELLLAQANNEV